MLFNDSQVMDTVCVDEVSTMDVEDCANFEADGDADNRPQPSQMVIAMGLGEKTLFDRLAEVQQERKRQTDDSSGNDRNGIDLEELLRYLTSAASAIDELNKRHNIYHCDIKPQNILVVGGQAQVCDFGLARQVEGTRQTQLAFGTPAYGAPEMLFGRTYSRTIDQYSLAVTYYHLRTGSLPFDSKTQSSFLRAKATGELDLSRVPRAEQNVLARATQLDPDDRYEDCQTFVSELRAATLAPEPTHSDSRKWIRLALVGAVSLVAGLAVYVIAGRPESLPVPEPLSLIVDPPTPTLTRSHDDLMESPDIVEPTSEADSITELSTDVIPVLMPETPKETPRKVPATPKPKRPDLNETLLAILKSDRSQTDQFNRLSEAIGAIAKDQRHSVFPATIDTLLQSGEQAMAEILDLDQHATNKPTAEWERPISSLASAIARHLDATNCHDDSLCGRAALIELQLAMIGTDPADLDRLPLLMTRVREYFGGDKQSIATDHSAAAAMSISTAWNRLSESSTWNQSQADIDLRTAERLNKDSAENRNRLTRIQNRHLLALLSHRSQSKDLSQLDSATTRLADLLSEEADSRVVASVARLIVAADKGDVDVQPVLPKEPPSSWPANLQLTYQLAAGWSFWMKDNSTSALGAWKAVVDDPMYSSQLARADRERAASYLVSRLIKSSKVDDADFQSTRYATSHQNDSDALDIASRLAPDSTEIRHQLTAEQFLCWITAKDFEQAEKKWQEIATFTGQGRPWTPQFGHAVQQLANHKLESSSGDPIWIDALLVACIAQSAAAEPSDKNMTSALFRASFQPAMHRIKPLLRRSPVEKPNLPSSLESKNVTEFCDRFVTLAATPRRRDDYKSLLTWWDDVEVAAVIAGQQAKTRQDKTRLFSIAADAFIHARYEQQDNILFESVVETLESYHRAAVALGSDTASEFIAARMIDQRGFRETDPEKSMQMYPEVIAEYDAVIAECVKQRDARLGDALRCRASTLIRMSRLSQSDGEELQQQAIDDIRRAIKLEPSWHSDMEHRLGTLADIFRSSASALTSMPIAKKNELLDEAESAIDRAIEMRKSDSFPYTHLALKKMDVIWIDLLTNAESNRSRFDTKQRAARGLMQQLAGGPPTLAGDRPSPIGLPAESDILRCIWHCNCALLLDAMNDLPAAVPYIEKAYEIASSKLDPGDHTIALITLYYAHIKGKMLGSMNRSAQRTLLNEIKTALDKIVQAPPKLIAEKEALLKEISARMTQL